MNGQNEQNLERDCSKVLKQIESMSPEESERRKYLPGTLLMRRLNDGTEIRSKQLKDGKIIDLGVIKKGSLKPNVKTKDNLSRRTKQKKNGKNKKQKDIQKTEIEKFEQSSFPMLLLRLCPFAPIDKISKKSELYKSFVANKNILKKETPYGFIEIRNRLLTQHHKAILDAIIDLYLSVRNVTVSQYGTITIEFSAYEITKRLNLKWGGTTKENIINALLEIKDTGITIRSKDNNTGTSFQIISVVHWEGNDCWIKFSGEYTTYLCANLTINYKSRLDEILQIKGEGSALIKSIVNFFITQKIDITNNNSIMRIGFDKLMAIIGYPIEKDRMQRSAIGYINKYKEKLSKFGINYFKKEKIFTYRGTNGIKFIK